jgi:hypothetical protein
MNSFTSLGGNVKETSAQESRSGIVSLAGSVLVLRWAFASKLSPRASNRAVFPELFCPETILKPRVKSNELGL